MTTGISKSQGSPATKMRAGGVRIPAVRAKSLELILSIAIREARGRLPT